MVVMGVVVVDGGGGDWRLPELPELPELLAPVLTGKPPAQPAGRPSTTGYGNQSLTRRHIC